MLSDGTALDGLPSSVGFTTRATVASGSATSISGAFQSMARVGSCFDCEDAQVPLRAVA
ncbi:hypothetical protein [Streptomyces cyaneochromogenes]|uniref:hypothetical protein n=1 Tax=Streptomyces cyaneochromogenes TaxID=2496836 RepID=UPI00158B75E8|nr:hypothetical protein [Streptomyces cyaneochromogenes]